MTMKIILYQPQIPQNTGNIVRSCSVTGTDLVLVRPLGFSTQSRHLKRAGLDYWEGVHVEEIDDLDALLEQTDAPFFFFSSKVNQSYVTAPFTTNSLLIFGSETTGLPSKYLEKYPERFFTIPMLPTARCLNLATSVGIVLFEAIRATQFFEKSDKKKEMTTLTRADEVTGK